MLEIYNETEARSREIQTISIGDPFDTFYQHLGTTKDFHRKYPNERVENLEKAYKKKIPGEFESATAEVDNLFTGEEAFGKYLDLTILHESYLNLPGVKRVSYLQYLDIFDHFTPPQCPIKKADKLTDHYFAYVGALSTYLEDYMRRTRPLEDLDQVFAQVDEEFEQAWEAKTVPGWGEAVKPVGPAAPRTQGTGEGIWCVDCEKEFKNDNVYRAHLNGKKHIKAAEAKQASTPNKQSAVAATAAPLRLQKDRAVAEREFRSSKFAAAMQVERSDTKVNVERKQGMTERERQMELEALFAETDEVQAAGDASDNDSDSSEKIYNPLKLPLAWDGKPIPYWLYKLHGLGVEFNCEICGNFVYMGRRAFDKHFSDARHVYGLKCLGINNTSLFREITVIEHAVSLRDKLELDRRAQSGKGDSVIQMEDAQGNVMPEKVYYEYVFRHRGHADWYSLQKQGLL